MFRRFFEYRTGRPVPRGSRLPLPGQPREVYIPDKEQTTFKYNKPVREMIDMDNAGVDDVPERFRQAWHSVRDLQRHFVRHHPLLKYRKCLGWGGNGLAAVFDDVDESGIPVKSYVAKVLFRDEKDLLEAETDNLKEHLKAEHIVQLIYSDGDGLISENDAKPAPETLTTSSQGTQPKSIMVFMTEMLENGDLFGFICKVNSHGERIPNAILWRFFLCLVRMCIAMAYPPASLPENMDRPGPITETVPDGDFEEWERRMVHFDFDPSNIFVGDLRLGAEHQISPILKLGDFGLATEILVQKSYDYYEKFRSYGKYSWFSPEQFSLDWDYIQEDPHGVHDHPIAGNFGSHTNIWAVGETMETLITLCFPATPPKPTRVRSETPDHGKEYWTYAGHLKHAKYGHVDRQLIDLVLRCQAHHPDDRPKLRDLEELVVDFNREKYPYDLMEGSVLPWVHKILHEVPDEPRDPTGRITVHDPSPPAVSSLSAEEEEDEEEDSDEGDVEMEDAPAEDPVQIIGVGRDPVPNFQIDHRNQGDDGPLPVGFIQPQGDLPAFELRPARRPLPSRALPRNNGWVVYGRERDNRSRSPAGVRRPNRRRLWDQYRDPRSD
ncbi:kinase-like domain-containing protein [Xylariaceae sp. FL0594]|nr:kinase-like domain-containing protein [Xylariaceae sp. FL0594]